MSEFANTNQNRVRRLPERGAYDKETIYAILDAAIFCHVGIVQAEQPVVIPTLHARIDDRLLLHGATTSRLLKYAQTGQPLCVTVTLLDGLVLARSVFHHSVNYRSAVLFGQGHLVAEKEAKLAALAAFTERLLPGRWQDARQPSANELKATAVVAMPISSASAKVRTGPPGDDEADMTLPVWSGVVPLQMQVGEPIADPTLMPGIEMPEYLRAYVAARSDKG